MTLWARRGGRGNAALWRGRRWVRLVVARRLGEKAVEAVDALVDLFSCDGRALDRGAIGRAKGPQERAGLVDHTLKGALRLLRLALYRRANEKGADATTEGC